ncbi:MAG: HEPN domain-containing protein [Lachnospiraceae bacterium]|nr:HEPN domain-containing protein [Lachnospiraceae bacterium]
MCDIRYFKSAYHCYDVAANLMRFYKSDEMYLNDVAYNLQQCVEKTLKAFLECKGVTVPPTHSIRKLIAMSRNQGSVVIITDWIEKNQFELEAWEADTRYNFDICLEAERIETGLREVKLFLERNHMGHLLNPDLTDEQKTSLRKLLPRDLEIRDDFEWNCYYNIFKKKLADTADTADLV